MLTCSFWSFLIVMTLKFKGKKEIDFFTDIFDIIYIFVFLHEVIDFRMNLLT